MDDIEREFASACDGLYCTSHQLLLGIADRATRSILKGFMFKFLIQEDEWNAVRQAGIVYYERREALRAAAATDTPEER